MSIENAEFIFERLTFEFFQSNRLFIEENLETIIIYYNFLVFVLYVFSKYM